jgi:RNA polymerase sigma factor (sigma-70 family)
MPTATKSQLLIFRSVDRYLRGRLPFEAMQERIEGFVSATVRRELRRRHVQRLDSEDDLAAHDDVAQEIWRKLERLRHNQGARFRAGRHRLGRAGMSNWLATLCRNEVVNYCRLWRDARRRRKVVTLPVDELNTVVDRGGISREPAAGLAAEAAETRAVIAACLDQLSIRDREAIRLRYWESLTDREAAPRIGRTAATFTRRVNKATARLKSLLAERGINAGWLRDD